MQLTRTKLQAYPIFLLLMAQGFQTSFAEDVYVREFSIPTPGSGPLGITVDSNGMVWFTESNASKIGRFDPRNTSFKEYPTPTPNSGPELITTDREGNLWFTMITANKIGRLHSKSERFTEYDIPTPKAGPTGIVVDRQGYVWFSEFTADKIGRLDPRTGKIVEFGIPTNRSGPLVMALDGQGNVWFTEAYAKKIGKFDPIQLKFTEYPIDSFSPVGIVVKENIVWFADHGSSNIGKLDIATGTVTKYVTSPASAYPVSLPNGLAMDDEGNLWLSEHAGNKVAKFIPAESVFVEYVIPSGDPIAIVLWIALDQKGQPWFAEWATNKIGTIDISAAIPFSLRVASRELIVQAGKASTLSLDIAGKTGGQLQTLRLDMTGRPYGVIASFARNPIELSEVASTTVTLSATPAVKSRTYPISVSITDGRVVYTVPASLTIQKVPESQLLATDLTTAALWLLAVALLLGAFFFHRKLHQKQKA